MSILDTKVTLFASCRDTEPKAHPTLGDVLRAIKSPSKRTAQIIAACRAEPDKKKRKAIKMELPAIAFDAELNHRRATEKGQPDTRQLKPSGILCLDFDTLPSLVDAHSALIADRHVIAVFVSPSGDGLKALVPVADDIESVWKTVADYYMATLKLKADESRKDKHGLCYASHDAGIWVADDPDLCEPFHTAVTSAQNSQAHRIDDGEVLSEYTAMDQAEAPLSYISSDCEYTQWIEIGQAIHCQFRGGLDGLCIWDRWSARGSKYQGQKDIENHYKSFKGGGITFRTVLKYAADAGWSRPGKPKRRICEHPKAEEQNDALGKLIAAEISGAYSLVPFQFPCLNSKARALLPGSVVILCGAPGGAKSWFVLSCLRHWVEQGIRADVLMLEKDSAWHQKRLLAQISGNTNYLDSDWCRSNPDAIKAAYEKDKAYIASVARHIHCDGNVTMEACAQWVESRCDEGARVLVIDPITLADPGSDKTWDADRRFMARLQVAIGKSGTSLILVSHPKKTVGKPAGIPQADDLAGGAAYGRASDSMLWLVGTEDAIDAEVMDADGRYEVKTIHKTMRILKARNGVGQGECVGFTFTGLQFHEEGLLVRKNQQTQEKYKRGRKMASDAEREADAEGAASGWVDGP